MASNKTKNRVTRKFYSDKEINIIQQKLDMSGVKDIDSVQFMNIRLITTILLFIIIAFSLKIGYIIAPIAAIAAIAYYYFFNYFFLERRLKLRTSQLDQEALQFFEILTLTLEAGRNLEHALEITCQHVDSNLSKEFRKTLMEIKFGKSLLEALESMKQRIPSETINNIILNITQTNIFGNSILETMYYQIDFLREKQILEIRERMNKIPTKISIISVVFVIPLILLLILGPLFINLVS